jgi:hypothetical protein
MKHHLSKFCWCPIVPTQATLKIELGNVLLGAYSAPDTALNSSHLSTHLHSKPPHDVAHPTVAFKTKLKGQSLSSSTSHSSEPQVQHRK